MDKNLIEKFNLSDELLEVLNYVPEIIIPESRQHLLELSMGGKNNLTFDVSYEIKNGDSIKEAYLTKCKNGIVANFVDDYMRRRDSNSMVISDNLPTDKVTHEKRYGKSFDSTRKETLEWFKQQKSLIVMPFMSGPGKIGLGYNSLLILPTNTAFFALCLADLQDFIPKKDITDNFKPRAIVYVAPPFRHTHYNGEQVVVHNRSNDLHEVFSYNLYPGPSAKKGIYAVLLDIGEKENWVTLHASTVTVITPYELSMTIMHEGASGGGKSEMIEAFHREIDGRLKLGEHIETGESYFLDIADSLELHPVTDDMALCHPSLQIEGSNKLSIADAESGWFLRVDHIKEYGTEPNTEKRTIHPKEPILFMNIGSTPDSTCLIWNHIKDSNGKSCPNPRVIMPRATVENIVHGSVEVDVRSFGIRTPPSVKSKPSYGIIGIFHVLPASLAWLWRLVSPRGFANPSITDTSGGDINKMQSEGVGSYWPFTTGRMVDQANLLLKQFLETPSTRYILIPNQYIGSYKVGFAGQWATREYIARRGGVKFREDQLDKSRCSLLGYSPMSMKIDGIQIRKGFLQVNYQSSVGDEVYDIGAKILSDFFKEELKKYLVDDLDPIGRKIIEACLNDATVEEYTKLLPNGHNGLFA